MTFEQFEMRFPNDFMTGSIIAGLVCVVLGIMFFAFAEDAHNSDAERKAQFADALYSNNSRQREDLSSVRREARQSAAENMLRLEEIGILSTEKLSEEDERQIEKTASNGNPVHFKTSHLKWGKFWGTVLPYILAIFWLLAWGFSLLVYAAQCSDHEEEGLADLPWRRVWPWVYLALTFLPFGWFIWPLSWRNVKKARAKAAARAAVAEEAGEEPENSDEEEASLPYHFVSSPQSAKALYIQLRQGAWRARLTSVVNDLKSKLDDRKWRLHQMSVDAPKFQREVGEFTASLAIKERQLDEPPEPIELSKLEEEFERIIRMPGVSGVRILNDMVCLLVCARIKYKGVLYDLGDWELSFGSELEDLRVRGLRSGVKPDWSEGRYPSYADGQGFCFGSRATTIRQHLRIGQFAEAINVAIDCMNSVNEGEEEMIPEAFYEVKA